MPETTMVPARLDSGKTVLIEVTQLGPLPQLDGEQEIGIPQIPDLDTIWDTVSGIASAIGNKLDRAKAKKVAVEFGIEIGVESGQLTALLVKGTGKANLKVSLEW